MTSDAKIGLLLGLVFIFVIAFIINGLPHLKPKTTQAEVTRNMVSLDDSNLGVVDTEQNAGDLFNLRELMDQQTAGLDAFKPAVDDELVVDQTEPATPTDSAGQDVRSTFPLPSKETVDRIAEGLGNLVQSVAEASKAEVTRETTTEPVPVIHPPAPTSVPAPEDAQATRAAMVEKLRTVVARSAPKIYVVADGDNLAAVAKKAYGPEEGTSSGSSRPIARRSHRPTRSSLGRNWSFHRRPSRSLRRTAPVPLCPRPCSKESSPSAGSTSMPWANRCPKAGTISSRTATVCGRSLTRSSAVVPDTKRLPSSTGTS